MNTKVKFYLKKRTGVTSNLQVWLYYSIKGIGRLEYYTGLRADLKQWNKVDQRLKSNQITPDGLTSHQVNKELTQLEAKVYELHDRAKALNIIPSLQYFKENITEQPKPEGDFFKAFQYFIEGESNVKGWTPGTVTKLRTICNHLKEFQDSRRIKITFESIDQKFYRQFVEFLQNDKDHINNTVMKDLKVFKWFLNWATRQKLNKNLAYKDFQIELKTTKNQNIIFLTWPELQHLYNLPVKQQYLDRVRDIFVFQCFTGLRYSDVYNLKKSAIKDGFIQTTTIKTGETLTIELNNYSRAILEKYKDLPTDRVLPVISNQNYNEYLKELGKLAGIDTPETIVHYQGAERKERTVPKYELLTSHTGRKSFITNGLYLGIPAEVIMQWTGHKDHRTMEAYYKIVQKHRQREMNKFNQ
jgi:integrase